MGTTEDTYQLATDRYGRTVIVVPDDTARLLADASREGRVYNREVMWGSSADLPADHPAVPVVQTLLSAVVAADPEPRHNHFGARYAVSAGRGDCRPMIVARWVFKTQQNGERVPWEQQEPYTVAGSPHIDQETGELRFSG